MTQTPHPDPPLNVALIVPRTEAEGPGLRTAVWVQGCALRCPGCCNPEMLAFKDATLTPASAIVAQALAAGVEGVSFLGGEPTEQAEGLSVVARAVRDAGLTVMVFSGHTLAELRAKRDVHVDALLAATDLLVDGRYVETLRTTTRRYIGSTNQVLHFLTDRYAPDDPRFASHNTVELRFVVDAQGKKSIVINGYPVRGARTLPILDPAARRADERGP